MNLCAKRHVKTRIVSSKKSDKEQDIVDEELKRKGTPLMKRFRKETENKHS